MFTLLSARVRHPCQRFFRHLHAEHLRPVHLRSGHLRLASSKSLLHTSTSVGRKVTTPMWGVTPLKPMTEKDCADRVLRAIRAWDRFPADRADKLTLDARFVEDLAFDSLDLVEITMALEDEFEFEVEDEVAHAFKTPRDMFNYVADREMVFENEGL